MARQTITSCQRLPHDRSGKHIGNGWQPCAQILCWLPRASSDISSTLVSPHWHGQGTVVSMEMAKLGCSLRTLSLAGWSRRVFGCAWVQAQGSRQLTFPPHPQAAAVPINRLRSLVYLSRRSPRPPCSTTQRPRTTNPDSTFIMA